eukprot:g27208.t1
MNLALHGTANLYMEAALLTALLQPLGNGDHCAPHPCLLLLVLPVCVDKVPDYLQQRLLSNMALVMSPGVSGTPPSASGPGHFSLCQLRNYHSEVLTSMCSLH